MANSINITVTKSSVYDTLGIVAGYTGKKSIGEGDSYERIASETEDDDLLDKYWGEGTTDVVDVLKPFIDNLTDGDDGIHATLNMPGSWKAVSEGDVEKAITNYLSSFIISRWMRIVKPEEEAKYTADADKAQLVLRKLLYDKRKPTLNQN